MAASPLISKSKYLHGLQCDKLLWTDYNAKQEIPPPDDATKATFDQGHLVGEYAKQLYPGGIEIAASYTDLQGTLTESREAIARRKPLFEAAFASGLAYARADVLDPAPRDRWDIIEVKSSTEVKEVHLHDIALQRYAYEGAGLGIRRCFVCHINKEYVRDGAIDPEELFVREDITDEILPFLEEVEGNLKRMAAVARQRRCPATAIGAQCGDPYPCPLGDKCYENLPEHNVLTLKGIGKKGYELLEAGVVEIGDLPGTFRLTGSQRIQAEAVRRGRPHIDREEICAFLNQLEYPLYYLDFETFQSAIPLYDGVRPYQQVPFQFSLHVVERKGARPKHHGFLGDGRSDPRPGLLRALKPLLGTRGSIVAYNAAFEKSRLEEMAAAYPSYRKWWKEVAPRFVDLLVPFRSMAYYHPSQHGSASLKSVLPALCGNGYDGMAIGDGGEASRAYLEMTTGKLGAEEERRVRGDLEAYCKLDTEAMIKLVEKLREMIQVK